MKHTNTPFSIKRLLPFLLTVFFLSCANRKDVVYYQNVDTVMSTQKNSSYEVKFQPDDLLMIIVSSEDPEAAIPFNLSTASLPSAMGNMARGQETIQSYLVDSEGKINFPVLGQIKVSGLTRTELMKLLKEKIGNYIKNPIINLRIMNFKISVQGEVVSPGTYSFASERVTIIEALSMAKDLTIYGKRNNILIIREIDGVKSTHRIDITKAEFINSPYYYLAQNDVVYVEPSKTKINGAAVGPNTGVLISITSLIITLITLIVK